jgi:hypothetical protein
MPFEPRSRRRVQPVKVSPNRHRHVADGTAAVRDHGPESVAQSPVSLLWIRPPGGWVEIPKSRPPWRPFRRFFERAKFWKNIGRRMRWLGLCRPGDHSRLRKRPGRQCVSRCHGVTPLAIRRAAQAHPVTDRSPLRRRRSHEDRQAPHRPTRRDPDRVTLVTP